MGTAIERKATPPWLLWSVLLGTVFVYFEFHVHFWLLELSSWNIIKVWFVPLVLSVLVLGFAIRDRDLSSAKGVAWPFGFLFMYFIFGLFSLLRNEDLYNAIKFSLVMFGPVALLVGIFFSFRRNESIIKLLWFLVVAGVFACLYVLYFNDVLDYMSLVGKEFQVKNLWSDQLSTFVVTINYVGDLKYQIGFFAHSKTLEFIDEPAFAAMLIPLVYFGFGEAIKARGKGKALYLVPSFLLWSLANTGSRISILAFFAGLAILLFFIRPPKKETAFIVSLVGVLTFANMYVLYRLALTVGQVMQMIGSEFFHSLPAPLGVWFTSLEHWIGTLIGIGTDGHVLSIPRTMEFISSAPFFGVGPSKFDQGFSDPGWTVGTEHNRYLYIWGTAGLLSLLPYVAFLGLILSLLFRECRRRVETDFVGPILLATTFAFVLQINNCGRERYYYWVFFALALVWLRNSKRVAKI